MRIVRICRVLAIFFAAFSAGGAGLPEPMPRLVRDHDRYSLNVDGHPYFVLGAQMHNSSAWPDRMDAVWQTVASLHVNTLEAPIYWETMEPQPGHYDFSGIDMLIDQARAHRIRLVLLWFGTWKNGAMHYAPAWIKRDDAQYPRLRDEAGHRLDGLSPFGAGTLDRDRSAFAAMMSHVKARDAAQHTVIMVQVENEPGLLGTARDHGAAANAAFDGPVPDAILHATGRQGRNWREAFGIDAEEAFSAAAVSRYVESVAEAGKKIYALPLYTNAWMRYRGLTQPGTDYPSGGPTVNELEIWKADTPSIDVIGSDVYTDNFTEFHHGVLPYGRPDNPPFVSESGFTAATARWPFDVLGRGGIGCSIFGIDNDDPDAAERAALEAHGDNGRLLAPIASVLAVAASPGGIAAFVQEPGGLSPEARLGDWQVKVSFGALWGHPSPTTAPLEPGIGRVIVARIDATHFLVAGMAARVEFATALHDAGVHEVVRVEEGRMDAGGWTMSRLLNGDETDYGVTLRPHGQLLRIEVTP